MKKRGVVYDTIFLYVLSILVILIIIIFGYQSVTALKDRQCDENLIGFVTIFQDRISELDNAKSTIRKESIPLGCGIEKVYFIDLKEKPTPFFDGGLLINNSLNDGSMKNIFMVRKGSIAKEIDPSKVLGFYLDDLEIDFPYFTCTLTHEGILDVTLQSTGYSTKVWNHDYTRDCGFWAFLEEIVAEVWPTEDPVLKSRELLFEIQENQKKIDGSREILVDGGETEVVVTLKAKEDIESLHHFEIISKCLAASVDKIDFDLPPSVIINEDPLLMWEFDNVQKDEELVIRYNVQEEIDEICRQFIKSLSETMEGNVQDMNSLFKNQEMDVEAIMDKEVEDQNDEFIHDLVDVQDDVDELGKVSETPSKYAKRIAWIDYKIMILEMEIQNWKRSLDKLTGDQPIPEWMKKDWEEKVDAKIDSLTRIKEKLDQKKKELLEKG
jgi:hypothetical protein